MYTVRKARTEDRGAIWRVHISAIKEGCAGHYSSEVIQAWVARTQPQNYIAAISGLDFLLAEEDGVILGFGILNATHREIQGLYVSPESAGRGIGTHLMHFLENRAREMGIETLQLFSSLNAVSFYKRLGYQAREELKHQLSPGIVRTGVRMEKRLAPKNVLSRESTPPSAC
jgi:N-acetylglutamate synthase-like GNAT family acetyltransferase